MRSTLRASWSASHGFARDNWGCIDHGHRPVAHSRLNEAIKGNTTVIVLLRNAFLAIVADTSNTSNMKVQAPTREDIEKVFPRHVVRFRGVWEATVPAKEVMGAMAAEVAGIFYSDFLCDTMNPGRHATLRDVQGAINRFQVSQHHIRSQSPPANYGDWPLTAKA